MTEREALAKLARSTCTAIVGVLGIFAPEAVVSGEVSVEVPTRDAVGDVELPVVLANVAYVDGVTGGNLFVMPVAAVRRLGLAMMGMDATGEIEDGELTELELSAVGEAMNQMMAAAATSTSSVLGAEVDISTPTVRVATTQRELEVGFQGATSITVTQLSLFGEPCRLVQFVPTAFTMRMTRALNAVAPVEADDAASDRVADALRDVPLRLSVEIGRTSLPSASVAALGDGELLELDRAADDPVDIYVAGSRFATGRLVLIDELDWGVRIDHVLPRAQPLPTGPKGDI